MLLPPFELIVFAMNPYAKKIILGFSLTFCLCLLCFCLIFFLRPPYTFRGASDAFFISAAVGYGVCGMIFAVRSGSFDVLNYGVYRLFESFRLDRKKRWDNAGDYQLEKKKKRQLSKAVYWPSLAVASLFLLLALVFLLLFYLVPSK